MFLHAKIFLLIYYKFFLPCLQQKKRLFFGAQYCILSYCFNYAVLERVRKQCSNML